MEYDNPEPTPEHARPKRRLFAVVAGAWFAGGIFLVALGGFVYWQTEQDDDKSSWVYLDPSLNTGDGAVAGASSGPAPLGERQYRLVVDSLEIDAPVSPFGANDSGAPEVPTEGDIVAWYTFSARPGNGGNAVFCARASWNGAAVFSRLGELENGDRFSLIGANGAKLTYSVIHSGALDSSATGLAEWFAATEIDAVTLLTCDDPWYTETPTADDSNYVVRGAIVEFQAGSN